MTTTKNNEHKKLNFPNEQEQSQACLNSAEHEKNQGRKVLNVPNLRFPEFEGEWEKMRLDAFTERVMRKNKSNQSRLPLTISAQYGLVDQITFFNKVVASTDLSNYYLLKKGEFAYNKSYSSDYPWGAIKRLDNYDQGALSSLYICFAPQDNVVSDFILQYFESPKWHKGISEIAVEGARNHGLLNVAVQDFFHTYHYIPKEKKEQIKISKLLMLLDERIATQNKVINRLQSLIKGIANKSFHVARETKPLLEFAPNITSGNDKNGSGTIPLYGSTGIIGMVKNASQKGNIVLVARVGTIGTVQFVNEPCGVSDNALIIKAGDMTKYIYYFLKTYNFARITSGTTQPLITASSLKKIAVPIFDIERSSNIVRCLSGLEKKLNIEKRYLLDMVMIKQYLLRQMFI